MDISWQKEFATSWLDRIAQGRTPHAVLLAGPGGLGKREAASWMAARHLGMDNAGDVPQFGVPRVSHADLRWVTIPEDKQSIGIDQVRELVAEISLTSYKGGGKVAVIEPADKMTTAAANSLLKTLEEPPGNALLILIADRNGRLPATIFSRCQRIDFNPPSEADGLAWLDRVQPGTACGEALRLAGNAPLAALDTVDALDTHAAMSRDLAAVAAGRSSALALAERWTGLDTGFVLDWLARQVQLAIFRASGAGGSSPAPAIEESVLRRMDRRNLFCYLDIINRLRDQPGGSFNVQLTLEGLLIELSEGLEGCNGGPRGGEMPLTMQR